jgi:hypothetical protein
MLLHTMLLVCNKYIVTTHTETEVSTNGLEYSESPEVKIQNKQ